MRLPEAVEATDALLNPHRVPRQVVVDERTAVLEVKAFAADLADEEHLESAMMASRSSSFTPPCIARVV